MNFFLALPPAAPWVSVNRQVGVGASHTVQGRGIPGIPQSDTQVASIAYKHACRLPGHADQAWPHQGQWSYADTSPQQRLGVGFWLLGSQQRHNLPMPWKPAKTC